MHEPVVSMVTLHNGQSVPVQYIRHARAKRLKMTVSERGIRITLPLRASIKSADTLIHAHQHWLIEQLAQHDQYEPLHPFESACLPLRGIQHALIWREGNRTYIEKNADSICISVSSRCSARTLSQVVMQFLEAEARADIGLWLPKYLQQLPRAPSRISFKRMSSQWGSLSIHGVMALDLSLILGQSSAFEYVFVHELCHLIHHNHSADYWREVESRFPQWRSERDYLSAHGQQLKAQLRALTNTQ